jgi:hypothetical protein
MQYFISVDIEKEGMRLYENNTNEGTYLMVFICSMLLQVFKYLPAYNFKW